MLTIEAVPVPLMPVPLTAIPATSPLVLATVTVVPSAEERTSIGSPCGPR